MSDVRTDRFSRPLSSSSPVFRAMLYGGFQEGFSEIVVVHINDVPPEAFAVFLGFMCQERLALADLQVSQDFAAKVPRLVILSSTSFTALAFRATHPHSGCPCVVFADPLPMASPLRAQIHGLLTPSPPGCKDDSGPAHLHPPLPWRSQRRPVSKLVPVRATTP